MTAKAKTAAKTGSDAVDEKLASLGDWRSEALSRVREIIKAADPDVTEDAKWRKAGNPLGVPTWEHDGIICTGESYKEYVKLTFARGASLPDPKKLFNSSLEGATRRAIDIRKGEKINEAALKALVKAAVAANASKAPKKK
jgi:hypothetical protein